MTYRIGFCCKWIDPKGDPLLEQQMNQKSTTITHLRGLDPAVAYQKLWNITAHNCDTLWRQLRWIAAQPRETRLFRVTSDFIPAYTVPDMYVYFDHAFMQMVETNLKGIRDFADANGIRLCSHPGQFSNICSDKPAVVTNAIEDLESHALIARMMGYGDFWHSSGYVINIHANNRQDPGLVQFMDVVENRLSESCRNLISLENDEFSCSVDDIVASGVGSKVALVLDIHHHFIQSGGEYIQPTDPRIQVFKDSWRGQRPLGHFSTSSEEILTGHSTILRPDFVALGLKPAKLRAHSMMCWNQDVNEWAAGHLAWMDIEVEAKGKNLASHQLYEEVKDKVGI